MSSREQYLSFLRSYNKNEKDVLPLVAAPDEVMNDVLSLKKRLVDLGFLSEDVKTDLTSNDLIAKLHCRLTDELTKVEIDHESATFAGMYPFTSFNGECRSVTDGYLLLINTGCVEILEALCSVHLSLERNKPGVIKKILLGYSCTLRELPNPATYPAAGIDESNLDRVKTIAAVTNEAASFVLAHELAHATFKHQGSTPLNELEADAWATLALLRRNRLKSSDVVPDLDQITFAGIFIYLCAVDCIAALRSSRQPDATTSFYPSPLTRAQLVVGIAGELNVTLSGFAITPLNYSKEVRELLSAPKSTPPSDADCLLCSEAIYNAFSRISNSPYKWSDRQVD